MHGVRFEFCGSRRVCLSEIHHVYERTICKVYGTAAARAPYCPHETDNSLLYNTVSIRPLPRENSIVPWRVGLDSYPDPAFLDPPQPVTEGGLIRSNESLCQTLVPYAALRQFTILCPSIVRVGSVLALRPLGLWLGTEFTQYCPVIH